MGEEGNLRGHGSIPDRRRQGSLSGGAAGGGGVGLRKQVHQYQYGE